MAAVVVPATLIEDGEVLPMIGDRVRFPVRFIELPQDAGPDGDAHVVVERVSVELPFGSQPWRSRPLGGEPYGDPFWVALVRASSWTASWSAPRMVTGPMTARGMLVADWDVAVHPEARLVGRIARVRVVSYTVEYTPGGATLERRVAGSRRLRDVVESPRWFARGAPASPELRPARWVSEDGVLVDVVDLDGVENGVENGAAG